ncbi:hypothetical protein E4U42_003165 [Claviceps africana]|uniref:SnoaL-like domain-containing protein n=1 Tax=Claviceps africana TaxID=83212 RepID=A0A8K0J7A0_9HYPO|nr:hypothetical protein E4U42_003165 [Claviceps africana]
MPPFVLTKALVCQAFAHLAETEDLAVRGQFNSYIDPDVVWTCAGSAHSLAGTRHGLRAHGAATFDRLGRHLRGPIRFAVTSVVVDAEPEEDGWWCSVEARGEATRVDGRPYNNEYVWLMRWDGRGKVVEIRSYFDTMLSEQVLLGGMSEPRRGEEE